MLNEIKQRKEKAILTLKGVLDCQSSIKLDNEEINKTEASHQLQVFIIFCEEALDMITKNKKIDQDFVKNKLSLIDEFINLLKYK